jgi:lipopolysaccharide/colanic/teichoic acid biosynthesis glycosyltransferase
MKRLFDFFLSLLLIILLSPLLIPISIILLLTGEHYIFFKHKRMGKAGNQFELIKFSTMLVDSPNLGSGDFTVNNDPRVLPVGKYLRITKINELPQLLNILIGDMSFVGPRPLAPKIFNNYKPEGQLFILKMKPGLTGIGSIVFRNEEAITAQSKLNWADCLRTEIMPYKARLEEWYFIHKNFFVDIMILFLTFWVVVFPFSNLPFLIFKDLPEKPDFFNIR